MTDDNVRLVPIDEITEESQFKAPKLDTDQPPAEQVLEAEEWWKSLSPWGKVRTHWGAPEVVND